MNALAKADAGQTLAATTAEIERALLGACMSYPTATEAAISVIEARHFGCHVHAAIWSAAAALVTEGRPVNPVTLGAVLGNEKIEADLTMRQYLAAIAADTSCTANFVIETAKQVRDYWALRELAAQCEVNRASALSPGARPRELISNLIQEADAIRATLHGTNSMGRSASEAVSALLTRVERQEAGETVEACVTTGLHDLDRMLVGGFKSGELIVVAGRPGMGKSIFGVSFARQAAKAGHAGGLFSLEMPELQVTARLITDAAFDDGHEISASKILQNQLTEAEREAVYLAERDLGHLPLLIDDSSGLTVGEVSARARSWQARCERAGKKLSFIVIDYLKFLRASERYRGQRHYEVGEITAGLKTLAKDLGIAVVLLVQLNREVEKTPDKRPELAHLRESGDIEADADVVLLLFREAYYLAMTNDTRLPEVENHMEIILAKQRMGQTGLVKVFCHTSASALRNLGRH
jgi:replicative DNA helicase